MCNSLVFPFVVSKRTSPSFPQMSFPAFISPPPPHLSLPPFFLFSLRALSRSRHNHGTSFSSSLLSFFSFSVFFPNPLLAPFFLLHSSSPLSPSVALPPLLLVLIIIIMGFSCCQFSRVSVPHSPSGAAVSSHNNIDQHAKQTSALSSSRPPSAAGVLDKNRTNSSSSSPPPPTSNKVAPPSLLSSSSPQKEEKKKTLSGAAPSTSQGEANPSGGDPKRENEEGDSSTTGGRGGGGGG